ncbi:MAG: hypothetical protein Q4G05_06260 [Clostridia bacterium]|nr:hypothetical protein [Clostridia bacterium]
MNLKKVLMGLLIIVVVVFAILIIRESIINNDGKLNKENLMTREETILLLQKGATYNNYYYSPDDIDNENKTEYYIKDNIVVCYNNSELMRWTDLNNMESISIWDMGKEKKVASIASEINVNPNSQAGYDYSLIADYDNYNFKYLGEKEENGKTTIIVKTDFKGANGYTKFYIDKDTGVITARKDVTKFLFISVYTYKCNRNVKFDIVTDEDIQKPDLEQYEVQKYN